MKILNFKKFRSEFSINVATLLSGSVLGQAFIFLITPILTRLYSKELFGAYFLFISTINILKIVTTLRFEIAIVLPKRDYFAINAFVISLIITTLTSLFFFLIAIVIYNSSFNFLNFNKIKKFIFLIPLSLFFSGLFETLSYWNNRFKEYKKLSFGKAFNNISNGIFQITLSKLISKNFGLIFGNVIGQIVSSTLLLCLSLKNIIKNLKYLSFRRIKLLLAKYKDIPTFNTLINLINTISNELPIYLFTFFFSPEISGLYGMANKLTAAPMDLAGQAIESVFYQKGSEKYHQKQLLPFFESVQKKLLKIGIILSILVLIITPFLDILLGTKWNSVKIYILILIPAIYANFLIRPLSGLTTILNKQKTFLIYQIIFILIKFIGIGIGFLFKNPLISLANFSVSCLIYRIIILKWYKKIVQ